MARGCLPWASADLLVDFTIRLVDQAAVSIAAFINAGECPVTSDEDLSKGTGWSSRLTVHCRHSCGTAQGFLSINVLRRGRKSVHMLKG